MSSLGNSGPTKPPPFPGGVLKLIPAASPASACRRYLENRLAYLDYKTTLKAGSPISSGETESGHRW
jgi:hypothetical protein